MIAAAVLAAALTVDDYVTMPTPSAPRVAPDGKHVAYVLTRADMTRGAYDSDVWLVGADGANDTQLTRSPGSDIDPKWSPDGFTLAFLSDRDGRTAIWTLAISGGEARKLNADSNGVRDFEWSPDGTRIAFAMNDAQPQEDRDAPHVAGSPQRQAHLYVIDVATKNIRKLTSGPFTVSHMSWSPDGTRIAIDKLPGFGLDDYYRSDLAIVNVEDGALTPLVTRPGLDATPRWSPDGKTIAFVSQGGVADWLMEQRVFVVPAAGGEPRIAPGKYDRTPDDFGWMGDQLWFNGPWNTTTQLMPIANVNGSLTDADVRGSRTAFVYQTLDAPPEVFIADTGAFAMKQLTRHNDEIRTRALGETRVIKWKNPKDGLEIEGLLTLPVGYKPGTRVPLLTFVHGGPASRFDQSYLGYLGHIYAPQVLAANGIAVLRPNPRGTGGYGCGVPRRESRRLGWHGLARHQLRHRRSHPPRRRRP